MALTHADELKRLAAVAAVAEVPEDIFLGIGTGSTVNFFIDALVQSGKRIRGAVSSSEASTERLRRYGIPVLDATERDGALPSEAATAMAHARLAAARSNAGSGTAAGGDAVRAEALAV